MEEKNKIQLPPNKWAILTTLTSNLQIIAIA